MSATLMLKLFCRFLGRLGNLNLNVQNDRTGVYLSPVYYTFLLFVDAVFRMPALFVIST